MVRVGLDDLTKIRTLRKNRKRTPTQPSDNHSSQQEGKPATEQLRRRPAPADLQRSSGFVTLEKPSRLETGWLGAGGSKGLIPSHETVVCGFSHVSPGIQVETFRHQPREGVQTSRV